MTPAAIEAKWTAAARAALHGKRIVHVRYMTKEEADALMIRARPLVLQLDDGMIYWASSDDEGNDGGAIHGQTKDGKEAGFPTL